MKKKSSTSILFCAFLFSLIFSSCSRENNDNCPTVLKLTASNLTPTVGDNLTLYAHNGQSSYNWTGPKNFAIVKNDGSDSLWFENIEINQSGWYQCSASLPGCNTLFDSIYIDVKYKQGTPPCALTNNVISGTGIPDLQASSVSKRFDGTWQSIVLYASGTFGYPTYTFIFNSYNGNTEPKDGIYNTTDVQSFNPLQDANLIYAQCQYSNIFFKTKPNQNLYVSHVNGKLKIAFCNLNFAGDNGNGVLFNSAFSGQITEN